MEIRKRIKANPSVLKILIIISFLLVGATACSPSKTSDLQAERTGAVESQQIESESSGAQGGLQETVQSQGTKTASTRGYDSPQEAVTAYLDGLRSGNLSHMIETFDTDNYLDKYIPLLESRNLFALGSMEDFLALELNAPSAREFYRDIAAKGRRGEIVEDILRQYSLLCRLDLNSGTVVLKEEGMGNQFVDQLSTKIKEINLGELKILGFLPPEFAVDIRSKETYQKTLSLEEEKYGADQVADQVVVVDLDGEKSILMFEVAEYGGRWYILQLGGMLAKIGRLDLEDAGTVVLDAEDWNYLEQEMRENGFLDDFSNHKVTPATAPVIESEGFDSPEKAAAAYLEGLKTNDLDLMMSAFAVESYVERYNLPARLEHVRSYSFMKQEFNLPVADEFSRAINIESRKQTVSEEIATQYMAVCLLNGSYYGNAPIPEETEENEIYIRETADMVDAMDFSSLKILGYIPPEVLSEKYDSDGMRDLRSSQLKTCGADNLASCAVAFEIGGDKYVVCPDVAEYNGKWYLKTMNGQLSNLLYISYGLMGTMPIDAESMPELEEAWIPIG